MEVDYEAYSGGKVYCIDSVAEIFYNSMDHLVKPLGNFDAVLHFSRQIISVFSAMGSDRISGFLK